MTTNSEWIARLDAIKPEARADVEFVREHFSASFGSMLGVVLDSLQTIEGNQQAAAKNHAQVVTFLRRVDKKLEAFGDRLSAIEEWRGEVDTDREDTKQDRLNVHAQLDDITAKLTELLARAD